MTWGVYLMGGRGERRIVGVTIGKTWGTYRGGSRPSPTCWQHFGWNENDVNQ
ncbi:hypothetical protein BKA93DRAFT_795750 [Sparassis latifolia]